MDEIDGAQLQCPEDHLVLVAGRAAFDRKAGGDMIQVEHLTKYFGPVQALYDVSFRVEKNEVVGLLGNNGAGKTTLMRILTTYLPAWQASRIYPAEALRYE